MPRKKRLSIHEYLIYKRLDKPRSRRRFFLSRIKRGALPCHVRGARHKISIILAGWTSRFDLAISLKGIFTIVERASDHAIPCPLLAPAKSFSHEYPVNADYPSRSSSMSEKPSTPENFEIFRISPLKIIFDPLTLSLCYYFSQESSK